MTKKLSLIVLSVVLAFCAAMCAIIGFKPIAARADENVVTEFKTESGASVRVSDKSGIRFVVDIPTAVYDSVVENGKYTEDSAIGMIIVPYSYVVDYETYKTENPDSEYTYYEFFANVKGKMMNFVYTPEQIATNAVTGGYKIKGSLVDILSENLERDFVGIGYCKKSGAYTYAAITEDDNARNITEVATKAIEDGNVGGEIRNRLSSLYGIDYNTVSYENLDLATEYYVNNAYGTDYKLPENIKVSGYNLKSLTATADGSDYEVTGGKLDRDITVTAKWTANIAYDDIPENAVPATAIAHTWTEEEVANAECRYSGLTYSYTADGNKPTGKWAFDWQGRLKASGADYAGIKIPAVNFNNYSAVYFYVYCNWGTRNLTAANSDDTYLDKYTVGTVGNTGDTYAQYGIVTIKGGKLYYRLNTETTDKEIGQLNSTTLNGTANIILSLKGSGNNIVISDLLYDGVSYQKDLLGINESKVTEVDAAHTWTEEEVTNAECRYSMTYTYVQDGNNPTTKWAFDWQGRLKSTGTGYSGIKIPAVNFNNYSAVYFYVYCNWGTKTLTTGDSSWYDQYTLGTVGNTGDTYEQYGIVTIKDGKLYYRLNTETTDKEIRTLTSAILNGTDNIVLSLKGDGNNIVISDLLYDSERTVYELDYVAAAESYAETITTDGTNAEKLEKLERYNFYKSYIEGNVHSAAGYIEPAIITALKESITDETIVEANISNIEVGTTLSTGKKITAGAAGTANTWYSNQTSGNNTLGAYAELQVVEDSSNANGFIKAGGRADAILNYTITLPKINFGEYCNKFGAVQFTVKGNGFSLSYDGTKINDIANTVEIVLTICDGKLFANGKFVSLVAEDVYSGAESLVLNVTRGETNTYGWMTISDVIATANFSYNDIATLLGRYIGVSDEILESISETEISGFDQSAPVFVSAKKGQNRTEALFFSSVAAKDCFFRYNKVRKVKSVSFDYLILSGSQNVYATINYAGSSGLAFNETLVADGLWRTLKLDAVDNNFGGFSVLIKDFEGQLLISNVNITENDVYSVFFLNSETETENVYFGETVSEPAVKTADGRMFVRWEKEDGTPYDFSAPVTSDIVLVARYEVYGPQGKSEVVAEWENAEDLTQYSQWNDAGIKDWTGTTGYKKGVPAGSEVSFVLPTIDYRGYGAISFKVTANWVNVSVKYGETVLATVKTSGGNYAEPCEIIIKNKTIIGKDGSVTITDEQNKGRAGVTVTMKNTAASSASNAIVSDFCAFRTDYRAAAENFSVTLSGNESSEELYAYLAEYNGYKAYYTDYELSCVKEPACIKEIKAKLANETFTVLSNANTITVSYRDSANGETTFGRTDKSAILATGSKYNIQKKDSATGAVICDYSFTVPATDYYALNEKYGPVYFTVCGGNAQKMAIGAFGNTVFEGTTGKEKADIIILEGKLYINGKFKANVTPEVYNGYAPFVISVARQSGDTYAMVEISDVFAAAEYEGLEYAGKNDDAYNYNPVEETADLVSDGKTDYRIVYSAENGSYETNSFDRHILKIAANDLAAFFTKATGADINVGTFGSYEIDVGEKTIVVGKLAELAGCNYSGLTTDTGYKILRDGNTIFIYGKTAYGTANGVYAFLNKYFAYEFYTDECYTYETTDSVRISALDETFNPDIDYIFAAGSAIYGSDYTDKTYPFEYQYRLGYATDHFVTGGGVHNFLTLISEEKYKAAHPNWFTTENWYNANNWYNGKPVNTAAARGTFTTLNLSYNDYEMVPTVAGLIAEQVNADNWNGRKYFSFSQPDRLGWSTAASSQEVFNKYGVYSAEYIIFMNKLAKYLDENCNLENEVTLQILAYGAIVEAPDYSEDTVLYSGDKVKVGVMYAPIERNNMLALEDATLKGVVNNQYNSYYAEQFKKWKALTVKSGEIGYWNYSTYIDNYFTPFDSITNKQADYKFAKSLGVNVLKDLGQMGNCITTGSDWDTLKNYIKVKLAKNVDADVETLIKNFCDAYYGEASSYMQELLRAERTWINGTLKERAMNDGKSNLGLSGGAAWINTSGNKKYWDEGEKKWYQTSYTYDSSMLKTWYGYILSAYDAVTDQTVKNRIKTEGLTIRYLLAKVYSDTTYGTMADIISDAEALGMRYYAESLVLSGLN